MRPLPARLAMAAAWVVLAGGCGSNAPSATEAAPEAESGKPVSSVLVLEGKPAAKAPRGTERFRSQKAPAHRKAVWPAPALNADGTIAGTDPFGARPIEAQPVPVEDDAATTAAIDLWRSRLRTVDPEQWAEWMDSGGGSPWANTTDAVMPSIVQIAVQRCGGARTVATGVVVAPETVATTVHVVESAASRVWVAPATTGARRIPAIVRYVDVDDDVAVLKVPGLTLPALGLHAAGGGAPRWGYAYGVGQRGGVRRAPVVADPAESVVDREQPDGFAQQISDRSIHPMIGAVHSGFSGGVVTLTDDPELTGGWGLHGLLRARVPFRADTGAILVPSRIVREAVAASLALDEWFEIRPGACPQWRR